jgi:addiction module RelE/StbE family toxin
LTYPVKYLPSFREDLKGITNYIADILEAPQAALNLNSLVENSCENLCNFPFAHRVYPFAEPKKHEYRTINIKNYTAFYAVEDNIVKIYRILYSQMDFSHILE